MRTCPRASTAMLGVNNASVSVVLLSSVEVERRTNERAESVGVNMCGAWCGLDRVCQPRTRRRGEFGVGDWRVRGWDERGARDVWVCRKRRRASRAMVVSRSLSVGVGL